MNKFKRELLDKTFQTFMDVGLGGENLDLLHDIVAKDVVGFGTALDEKIFGVKELLDLLIRQKEQSAGLQLSWKINTLDVHISSNENTAIFINEIFLYLPVDGNTIEMYLRLSVMLEYLQEKWLVVHWHLSKPEHVESEKDTWGIETWKEKAEELEKQVAERTADLVEKNRELAIEAALEKVRAVAMGMQKPADMLDVCRVISNQLQEFGVQKIRNVQIANIDENIGQYLCYQYFTPYDKTAVEKTEYLKSPVEQGMVKQMLASRDGYFIGSLSGKELEEFREHRKAENHFLDPFLDAASELDYCFLSIGEGGLGLTLYHSIADDILTLFKRFHQVFTLAYQRFRDIQKAEAQAREAWIEAALERVRSRSLAMHKSDELADAAQLLYREFITLNISTLSCGYSFIKEAANTQTVWTVLPDGTLVSDFIVFPLTGDQVLDKRYHDWKEKIELHTYEIQGEANKEHHQFLSQYVPVYVAEEIFAKLPDRIVFHCANFSDGYLFILATEFLNKEDQQIIIRFSKVFQQTYTRFLDLQKAEAQAREAQIELALERVRARSMAMQHSKELQDTSLILFQQLKELGEPAEQCTIGIIKELEGVVEISATLHGNIMQHTFRHRIDEPFVMNKIFRGWKDQQRTLVLEIKEEELQKYNQYRNELVGTETFSVKQLPGDRRFIHIAYFSKGMMALSTNEPRPEESLQLLERFAIVFEQTYIRFLDLKKAEAQAREAQIEAALERVRSRSLSIHKSDELKEVVIILLENLKELQIPFSVATLGICIDGSNDLNSFVCGKNEEGLVFTNYRLPYFDNPIPRDLNNALEKQLDFFVGQYSKEEKDSFFKYNFENTPEFMDIPEKVKSMIFESQSYTISMVPFKYAAFSINDFEGKVLSQKHVAIIKRFGKVFDQAYTRFLDIKRAESQARQAQIEVALERTRTQSMLMQHSDEIKSISNVFHEQLLNLGIPSEFSYVWLPDEANLSHQFWASWFENEEGEYTLQSKQVTYPLDKAEPYTAACFAAWANPEVILEEFIPPTEISGFFDVWQELLAGASKLKAEFFPDGIYYSEAYMRYGCFGINIRRLLSDEEQHILKRFSIEFERAYTRFLDLKKAEAQTREAKIEAALEKVRSRTMGMQQSNELADASQVLDQQVRALGIETWGCAFHIYAGNEEGDHEWFSSANGNLPFYKTPREQFFLKFYEKGQQGEKFHVEEFEGENCKAHYDFLKTIPVIGDALLALEETGISLPGYQIDHIAFFQHGYILFITYKPVPEAHEIFQRFAKVFEQTYTRFLDLQKAEAQAREAKIEAALEKVRSRTMGMRSSDELPAVANLLFTEVRALGIHAWSCGYNILSEDKKSAICCMSSEGTLQTPFQLRLWGEASFDEMGDFIRSEKAMLVQELGGKALEEHYAYMKSFPDLKPTFDEIDRLGLSLPTYQINHLCKFTQGFILFITYEKAPDAHDIFKRFTSVFDQTFTRFLDLKKAEAQARESQIELSLQRVRAQVTAMQESSDLLDIVVSMRSEFVKLGHEAHYFWHMRWLPETYAKAMTSGDGTKIGMVMTLPRHIHGDIAPVANWEKSNESTHVLAMDTETAVDYVHKMITLGDFERVDPQSPTLDDIRNIGGLTFVMARTTHGEIGFSLPGVVPEPSKDAVDTLVRFAGVFDLAYKRFEDLKTAEKDLIEIKAAREKAEEALLELKATQSQLVQQEKLASLGQLTAGIAHEIKNPLNFVNNFSEVSLELIDEALEEITNVKTRLPESQSDKNASMDEIVTILDDIKSNLGKIHQHGTRANGIVSSMLQHSRGGTGKKEPTDLNTIVKEYVNLCFHGMRAGKNPINVDIVLDLDAELGLVPLIREDFTRVVINLCNNAFDAMRQKTLNGLKDYNPRIRVQTTFQNDQIFLSIEDNGPGIPEKIKDKILQPFFTTKKGTEGTGLGLSITHDIVKAHGGELLIETAINKGTSFIIKLNR